MITRRHCFAAVPAVLAGGIAARARATFECIDTHVHLNRSCPPVVAGLESANWRVLTICDSRAVGDQPADLPQQVRGAAELHRAGAGRVSWAGSFDPRPWEEPEFAARTVAALEQQFRDGAIAMKLWKNVGMAVSSRSGAYLLPDNPALAPIFEMLQREGRTLVAHLADLNAAWMPIGADDQRSYYRAHPEWSMYGRAGVPTKAAILAAGDRLVARYPKLRVIGCHLGSNEEDLQTLAGRLDRAPNFAVDLAARVRYLAAGDRESARAFALRYQDRILYGTDFTLGPDSAGDERAWQSLNARHDADLRYFLTDEAATYGRRPAQGLALPESTVRKIFHDNAVRWLPGIV